MQLGDFFGPADVSGTIHTGTVDQFQAVPENPGRTKIIFTNPAGTEWYIKFAPLSSGVTAADHHVVVAPTSSLVLDAPIYTGSISATQAGAEGILSVVEFSKVN